ncbi:hypothetical protein ACH41E_28710 [Streptomyces sp. NPDC020412]|uniref:hypothetical protein n=1 Tax=Streptomyces sp. NPDC020412 TaxID=3365073 RepID=UPI0037A98355
MKLLRTAAMTTAALGLTLTSLSWATAAPAPKFLAAAELPPALTPWTAGPVAPGLPADFCTGATAPRASSKHRLYSTELDANARQTVTVAASEAKAKVLVIRLRAAVESCFDRMKQENPNVDGEALYHGKLPVEEGAHVYSIDSFDPVGGSNDVALYSVGRDGRTVTVVAWGQLGDLEDAALNGFQQTARTSVTKLY